MSATDSQSPINVAIVGFGMSAQGNLCKIVLLVVLSPAQHALTDTEAVIYPDICAAQ
jgi:hypothetical protein